ncbi:hypothetical protein Tco_0870863, partial [Tanacetum coccineum]
LSSFNNFLVKNSVILDSIFNVFEKLNDDIQAFEEITCCNMAFVKGTHGSLNMLVSLIFVSNILFIVSFNRGPEASIRDNSFFMLCPLFLSYSAEKNSKDLSEILYQFPFSERMDVVKFLEVRN